jgi:hypothetical protein
VSLCESDVGSTSDNDFFGSAVHDMAATPLTPGETSEIFSETLDSPSASYTYRYRISAEDPSIPPSCIP